MVRLDDILVGVSPPMRELKAYLPKLARSSVTVLIRGESGTGKEAVAQALHDGSPRETAPFVALNCAALPESLIESELFGHERGAFTGALSARPGHFRQAHGGTLFLDEIGDMSLGAQAKLLRVLERHEVTPLGSSRPQSVDVRVVAATHQPLQDLMAQGRFRADLFYRLNVAQLQLPSLRERKEDIPLLLAAATQRLNRREFADVGSPDAELLGCLLAHPWPGNVRELNNLVEAVFIDPPHGELRLSHLPVAFRTLFAGYRRTPKNERDRMLQALEQTSWNKSEAAKHLNWSRMTLYRKLDKYGL